MKALTVFALFFVGLVAHAEQAQPQRADSLVAQCGAYTLVFKADRSGVALRSPLGQDMAMNRTSQGEMDLYSIDFDSKNRVEISNVGIEGPNNEQNFTMKWFFGNDVLSDEACKTL